MADRPTLKAYFETGDVPTEAQFAELIDSLALTSELSKEGRFVALGQSGFATDAATNIVRGMFGRIVLPSTWTFGNRLYVTKIDGTTPASPTITISTDESGLYGSRLCVFENAQLVHGGFYQFTPSALTSSATGVAGELIVSTETFAMMANVVFSVPNPHQPGDIQPGDPHGYRSRYRINPGCVQQVGGTGGGSAVDVLRNLGNNCIALLNGASAASATYSVSGGVGTITLPAGVSLIRATVRGVAADASYSAGSYANAFKLRIVGESGNVSVNELLLRSPRVVKMPTSASSLTPSTPARYDDNTIDIEVDEATGSTVGYVADKLQDYYDTWAFVI